MDQQTPETPHFILCVDDDQIILKALMHVFRGEQFQVLTATSGQEGLALLKSTRNIALILSDQQMPEMTGSTFLKAATALVPDTTRMVLTCHKDANTAIDAINNGGAHRFLIKPWDEQELLQAVRNGVKQYLQIQEQQRSNDLVKVQRDELAEWNANLKKRVLQQTSVMRQQRTESRPQNGTPPKVADIIISRFVDLLDHCYCRLSKHSHNVAALAESMAKTLKLPSSQCDEIRNAALLHDIGKVGMPDRLLSRSKEMMNADDLKEYRSHTVRGLLVIDKIEDLGEVSAYIRHHHESFDGKGFPDGLAGERIPLGARIIAVADYADNAFTREVSPSAKYVVTKTIAGEMGRLFDPALASAANIAVMQILN
jgi:putative nucleotidyltransferase with HDIG domain